MQIGRCEFMGRGDSRDTVGLRCDRPATEIVDRSGFGSKLCKRHATVIRKRVERSNAPHTTHRASLRGYPFCSACGTDVRTSVDHERGDDAPAGAGDSVEAYRG